MFQSIYYAFELRPHDELNIPPVYERALKLTLAVEICPMFGVEPLPSLQLKQTEAFNMLKNSNVTPLYVKRFTCWCGSSILLWRILLMFHSSVSHII